MATFTKNGTRYTVESTSTWTTISGKTVTTSRVYCFNPATGHGADMILNAAQLAELRAR